MAKKELEMSSNYQKILLQFKYTKELFGINVADVKTEFMGKPLMLKLAPTMLR